jgi:hypothetical protein
MCANYDGELLQGLKRICNNRFAVELKNFCHELANTVVTLTHPYPVVTFRLRAFLSGT